MLDMLSDYLRPCPPFSTVLKLFERHREHPVFEPMLNLAVKPSGPSAFFSGASLTIFHFLL